MRDNRLMRIGILGVGAIAVNVIDAIQSSTDSAHTFYLSPRSTHRADALVNKYANCVKLETNQAVIDASDIVVLSVLPKQVDEVLSQLNFRPDHVVASFIAGRPPSEITKLVSPATKVAQLIPLPPIELHKGPLLICPPISELAQVFSGLGELVELNDENQIKIFSAGSATMSMYFTLQNEIIDWFTKQGIEFDLAAKYVTSLNEGLGAIAAKTAPSELKHLPVAHETPGGLNESVRTNLEKAKWPAKVSEQLDYLINVFIPGLKNKK